MGKIKPTRRCVVKETGRKYVGEAGIDLGSNKVRELKVLVERQISRERFSKWRCVPGRGPRPNMSTDVEAFHSWHSDCMLHHMTVRLGHYEWRRLQDSTMS